MLTDTPSKLCTNCGTEFFKAVNCSKESWSKRIGCSISCARKIVGNSWLRKHDFKPGVTSGKRFQKGDKPHNYKGDTATYTAKHIWVRYHYGRANHCEFCKRDGLNYHWSNISGEYKRDVTDWQQLCVSCHKIYDLKKRKLI